MALCGKRSLTILELLITALTLNLLVQHQFSLASDDSRSGYCPFFNNRAPAAQPGLQNCTWYKTRSCCMQQEIETTFGSVKPLQGASLGCQRHMNYLMCYICAPNQNIFYKQERLTVCEEFCDSLFDACKDAILKGSVIQHLYSNGREFCKSRRFQVERTMIKQRFSTRNCFDFDISLDTSKGRTVSPDIGIVASLLVVILFVNFGIISMTIASFQTSSDRVTKTIDEPAMSSTQSYLLYGKNVNVRRYLSHVRMLQQKSISVVRPNAWTHGAADYLWPLEGEQSINLQRKLRYLGRCANDDLYKGDLRRRVFRKFVISSTIISEKLQQNNNDGIHVPTKL